MEESKIENLHVNENVKSISNEEKVNIVWEGKKDVIILGEITWKEKKSAIRKSMKDVQRGRSVKKESDPVLQREYMMLSSIKKAPFELTIESLDKLSSRDGEKLYTVYAKINEYDEDEERGEA